MAGSDLVSDVGAGRVKPDAIATELRPAPIAAMEPGARQQAIAELALRRTELEAKSAGLGEPRRRHIDVALGDRQGLEESLHHQILRMVSEQATGKGLPYGDKAPVRRVAGGPRTGSRAGYGEDAPARAAWSGRMLASAPPWTGFNLRRAAAAP
jgi:hypothetical protein